MRKSAWYGMAATFVLAAAVACGGSTAERAGEPGAEGTAGRPGGMASKAGSTVLTGCLERNVQTGQFELVVQGDDAKRAGSPNAGMQPGHDRLELAREGNIELNQYVGRRITVEGMLGTGQPVTDAGTRSYGAGQGADPSQTRSREDDSRRMTVSAVSNVGDTCQMENR